MNYLQSFPECLKKARLYSWIDPLEFLLKEKYSPKRYGDFVEWDKTVRQLPDFKTDFVNLNKGTVEIGKPEEIDQNTHSLINKLLKNLHPWRKGPFNLFGIYIDTEWRSDLKWDRLKDHISDLTDRIVLDIGCGSGYHCWRMAGQNAAMVIGIEPLVKYVLQFQALHKYTYIKNIDLLPLALEELPESMDAFDTIFSMGIFYHRRSPFDHLFDLRHRLKPGGELVLETLVIDGKDDQVLVPRNRYAKMRNVWFIPSCLLLENWLKRSGFKDIRLISVDKTTPDEQRSTEWMTFESLPDFLNPANSDLTVEGYPAPQRAIFIANK